MAKVEFTLDREEMISKNVDATGKQWHIKPVRGFSLVEVIPEDPRVKVPSEIGGRWTKREWLQKRLDAYLNASWNKQEAHALKAPARARSQSKEA
jgi:hypothetical protein